MNSNVVLMVIRGLAQLFGLQGETKKSDALTLLANSIQSGKDVDAHMQLVADALESGADPDWDSIVQRLQEPL